MFSGIQGVIKLHVHCVREMLVSFCVFLRDMDVLEVLSTG
jgi:hypothetical protein